MNESLFTATADQSTGVNVKRIWRGRTPSSKWTSENVHRLITLQVVENELLEVNEREYHAEMETVVRVNTFTRQVLT